MVHTILSLYHSLGYWLPWLDHIIHESYQWLDADLYCDPKEIDQETGEPWLDHIIHQSVLCAGNITDQVI